MRIPLTVALLWMAGLPAIGQTNDTTVTAAAEKAAGILRQAAPEPEEPLGYLFNLDTSPTLAWRDAALNEHFGPPEIEEVVWFDAAGQRFETPGHAGRWIAVVQSRLPDDRLVMRSVTLFARPEGFFLVPLDALGLQIERLPEAEAGPLGARGDEVLRLVERPLLEMINGRDPRAALLAGALHDAQQDDAAERLRYGIADRSRHCELQARLAFLEREVTPLPAPRRIDEDEAAPTLRPAEVPLAGGARAKLDRICQGWADESGAAFVSLVAREGGILQHKAYTPKGRDPIGLDFRPDVFSITKSISGLLAARFLDAGMFALDDPVSTVLPGFATQPAAHVPTFRQCLRHKSGLQGHGSWGGVGNVWFDHLVLNGIETLHPGSRKYAGDGFDLVGSAMQLLTGKTVTRLFHRAYFEPLGLPPMPFEQMGSGARPTAFELATLGQIVANRGRYGGLEFFSGATFEELLPTPYDEFEKPDPDNKNHFYGLGIRWVREHKDEDGKPLFSRRVLGHGSFSHSVFMIDLERGLVISQVREKSTKADAKWFPQFLSEISRVTRQD